MKKTYYSKELYHFGIPGQKWGNRRYQNEDGTYTELGKERRRKEPSLEEQRKFISEHKTRQAYKKAVYEEEKESQTDYGPTKDILDGARNFVNSISQIRTSNRPKRYKPMDLSNKTDQEMRNEINRKRLENEYTQMFGEEEKRTGKDFVQDVLANLGPVLSAAGSVVLIVDAARRWGG